MVAAIASPIVRVVLRYDGNEYAYDHGEWLGSDDEAADTALYMYTEGNYSCDCNRSIFLDTHCPDDTPERWPGEDPANEYAGGMPCGDVIELVSLVFVSSDGTERVLFPEPDDSPRRVRERLAAVGLVGAF